MDLAESIFTFLESNGFFDLHPQHRRAVERLLKLNPNSRTTPAIPTGANRDLPPLNGAHDLEIFVDGAADLNARKAGIGGVFFRNGSEIYSFSEFIPDITNNQAEYLALCKALEVAAQFDAQKLRVCSDSQLMVRQLTGQYRVKHENMKPLYERAQRLIRQFKQVDFEHITRKYNKLADKLSKLGMLQEQTAKS